MTFKNGCAWLFALCVGMSAAIAAEQPVQAMTAHQLVRDTTEQVMNAVADAESYADEDPERYYREVQSILDPVVDYRGFARGVMGPYATSARYRSLDEAGRAQLRDQLDIFGTEEIMRIRLGIGEEQMPDDKIDFVLSDFPLEKRAELDEMIIKAGNAVKSIIENGVSHSMTIFNA